jgi:hypothetical protein
MTIEEMIAELEAAGYKFSIFYGETYKWWQVILPDGFEYNADDYSEVAQNEVVQKAYEHLQRERELERLRSENTALSEFVKSVARWKPSGVVAGNPFEVKFRDFQNGARTLMVKLGKKWSS